MSSFHIKKTTLTEQTKRFQFLHDKIYNLLEKEKISNPESYTQFANAKGLPYQSYERIGFAGLRWSCEKRIKEYGLEQYLRPEAKVLDIGSNYGFFVNEFATKVKLSHGVEPIAELNEIGELTAQYLKLDNKTEFFTTKFEDFKATISYDVIFSLASFFTSDKNQRSAAGVFFQKISNILSEDGEFFYESTSFQREKGSQTYQHYIKALEALDILNEIFDVYEHYEAQSGSESYRLFARCRKKL